MAEALRPAQAESNRTMQAIGFGHQCRLGRVTRLPLCARGADPAQELATDLRLADDLEAHADYEIPQDAWEHARWQPRAPFIRVREVTRAVSPP